MGVIKTCSTCGFEGPKDEFAKGRICRPCMRAKRRARYERDYERERARQAEYRAANLEAIRLQQHESYWSNPELARAQKRADHEKHRTARNEMRREQGRRRSPEQKAVEKARAYQWRYGITLEQRDEMLAAQGGVCAICKTDEPGGHGEWCTDHDHACCNEKSRSCGNCIRGILCFSCNVLLGTAKDRPETLTSAIEYLARANVSRMTPI